jgi:predicted enzyme related to lactoylglutathione lyase
MKKMNPVVHFELPAHDRKRMADFYTGVFGWDAQFLGEEMGNYVTVSTAETDENGQSKIPGTINGGLFQRNEEMGAVHPSLVIAVDDIHKSASELAAAGGKVIGEPMEIPGIGIYVSFEDTEGNKLSLLQPFMGK